MKRVLILLLVLSLGAAACGDGTTSTVDGTGTDDGSGTGGDGTVPEPTPEPAPTLTFFSDADGDGFGDPGNTVEAETLPEGYVADSSDCDDGDASIHPGAKDPAHDVIDQDCDGFFQWLAAEGSGGGFFSTWSLDTNAQEADNETHVGNPTGPLLLGTLYRYDSLGRVTRLENKSDRSPGLTEYRDFAYDEEGHVVEFVRGTFTDPASPTITEVSRFLYAGGLKVLGKVFRGDPASVPVQRSGRWTYDEDGRAVLFELFSGDFEAGGTLAATEEYGYDANGYLNGLVRKDGTGAIDFATALTNDPEGRPLTYKRFNGDPADPATAVGDSRLLEYDGADLTLYLDFSGDFDDPSSSLSEMYAMTYDGAGRRIGLRYFNFVFSTGPMAVVEWTYDENGNVLSIDLPMDERSITPIALGDEDLSLPKEPDVPSGPATFSNYFLAPFDIVELVRLPSLP